MTSPSAQTEPQYPEERIPVICNANKYNTELFWFDSRGIYVRCKDCRYLDRNGDIKRGMKHFYSWGTIFKMMLGIWKPEEVPHVVDTDAHPAGGSGGDHQSDEIPAGASERSTTGNP